MPSGCRSVSGGVWKDTGAPGERRGAVCGQADDSRWSCHAPLGSEHGPAAADAARPHHGDGGAARRQPVFEAVRRGRLRGRSRVGLLPRRCVLHRPREPNRGSHRRHVARSVGGGSCPVCGSRTVRQPPLAAGSTARPRLRPPDLNRPSRSASGWSARRAAAAPDPRRCRRWPSRPTASRAGAVRPGPGRRRDERALVRSDLHRLPSVLVLPGPGGIGPGPGGDLAGCDRRREANPVTLHPLDDRDGRLLGGGLGQAATEPRSGSSSSATRTRSSSTCTTGWPARCRMLAAMPARKPERQ